MLVWSYDYMLNESNNTLQCIFANKLGKLLKENFDRDNLELIIGGEPVLLNLLEEDDIIYNKLEKYIKDLKLHSTKNGIAIFYKDGLCLINDEVV